MGLSPGPLPARVDGEVKERLLKLVDDAVTAGWAHTRACDVLEVADDRVHRWRARLRAHGTLVDRAPGGNPVHRLLAWEEAAILALIEDWGLIDRSHRKLAHRGSYTGTVFVSPSSVLRVAAKHEVPLPGEPPRPPRPAPVFPQVPGAQPHLDLGRDPLHPRQAGRLRHHRRRHPLLDRLPGHGT
jgi:putative transposase